MDEQLQDAAKPDARAGDYTQNNYPQRSPVVLGTLRPRYVAPEGRHEEPAMEYRIGVVTAGDFEIGLSCRNIQGHRLNPRVARKCFGGSLVYLDKNEAIRAARPLITRAGCGIKVRNFNERWPGTDCTIL